MVAGCSAWGCSLELLQAASARAETKHIANSQVNFLVWFFMSFLRYASENCLNHRRHARGSSVGSLHAVRPHGESYPSGNRTCRHRWPSHTHGSSPLSTGFGQDSDRLGKSILRPQNNEVRFARSVRPAGRWPLLASNPVRLLQFQSRFDALQLFRGKIMGVQNECCITIVSGN